MNRKIILQTILIVITLIKPFYCIHSKDVCIRDSDISCLGDRKFMCKPDFCAKDETTCKQLTLLNHIKRATVFRNRLVSLNKFTNSIQTCPYVWHPSSLCFNAARKCFTKEEILTKNGKLYLKKNVQCQCLKSPYLHSCGSGFCSKHKKDCEEFQSMGYEKLPTLRNEIKLCHYKFFGFYV